MKINAQAEKALQQPDTQSVVTEMTPERKEKFMRVSDSILNLLRATCESPFEAYIVLHFIVNSFEENYGIRGGFSVGKEDEH